MKSQNPMRKAAVVITILAVLLQACNSDFSEINDRAIVNMVGVELDDKGNYVTYFQVVNPNGIAGTKAGGARSPLYTFEFKGKTWAEFTVNSTHTLSRKPFISHFQAYLVSERLAKKGLDDLLNFLEADPTRRMATAIFITKSPMWDMMNTYVPLEMNPGKELRDIRQLQASMTGKSNNLSRVKDLLDAYENSKLTFIANVKLTDNKPFITTKRFQTIEGNQGNYSYTGASIMKRGKWIGELDDDQLIPLFFMLNQDRSFVKDLVLGQGESAQVQQTGKPRMEKKLELRNGVPVVSLIVKPKLKLISTDLNGKVDGNAVKVMERKFEEQMTKECLDLWNLGLQNKWDLLGIEEWIKRKSGREWAKLKEDPDSWMNAKVSIHVQSSIVKLGILLTPYEGAD